MKATLSTLDGEVVEANLNVSIRESARAGLNSWSGSFTVNKWLHIMPGEYRLTLGDGREGQAILSLRPRATSYGSSTVVTFVGNGPLERPADRTPKEEGE